MRPAFGLKCAATVDPNPNGPHTKQVARDGARGGTADGVASGEQPHYPEGAAVDVGQADHTDQSAHLGAHPDAGIVAKIQPGARTTLQEMFAKGTAIVHVQAADQKVFEVESRVAFVSPAICRGFDPTAPSNPIKLANISSHVLERILDYCRFHTATGRSAKESRAFDKRFAKVDRATMCELASAAYYMELEPLIDLTCKAIASSIDWSSPEAIRDAFGLPDDLTEEEKLEPIACDVDDIRTKQYNNLLARKRKQLADSKTLSNRSSGGPQEDSRSLDELLAFIGEGGAPQNDVEVAGAGKKRNRKKKHKKKGKSDKFADDFESSSIAEPTAEDDEAKDGLVAKLASITVEDIDNIFNEFDDDDGLDPEMKAQQEKELAEFSSKLGLLDAE